MHPNSFRMEREADFLYVYGLSNTPIAAPLAAQMGTDIRSLKVGHYHVLAETVKASEFGEQALQQRVEDLQWLALKAVAHEQAINQVAQHQDFIPFKFASVFRSLASLRDKLHIQSEAISILFGQLANKEEWLLKVKVDREKLAKAAEQAQKTGAQPAAKKGTAYLLQKKQQIQNKQQGSELLKKAIAQFLQGLRTAMAVDLKPIKALATDQKGSVGTAYQCALLTDKEQRAQLAETIEGWQQQLAPKGISLVLHGSFAPFHFADLGTMDNAENA